MTKSRLTMISAALQNCDQLGLTFACGKCHRILSVTFELSTDGIELSASGLDYAMPKSSLPKLVWVRTDGGQLSISCGYCRSGETAVRVSLAPVGTSCSKENSLSVDAEEFLQERVDAALAQGEIHTCERSGPCPGCHTIYTGCEFSA